MKTKRKRTKKGQSKLKQYLRYEFQLAVRAFTNAIFLLLVVTLLFGYALSVLKL